MIPFPKLDLAQLMTNDGQSYRQVWKQSIVDVSKKWFTEGGDIQIWLDEFQKSREAALQVGWQLHVPDPIRKHLHYIRFGSAGRGEDLLASDLDYVIVTDGDMESALVSSHLHSFIRGMEELGFPPCKGFVMGTNPRWIGSPEEWKKRIDHYFAFPSWENVRYLFMMMDGRPLNVEVSPWTSIAEKVMDGIQNSSFICWEMAHLGIYKTVALNLLGRVKTRRLHQGEQIDFKDGFLNPMIHSIRLLAVSEGFAAVSTLHRLNWLESQGVLSLELASHIRFALEFGWKLRVCRQIQDMDGFSQPREFIVWGEMLPSQQKEILIHLETAKTLERMIHRKFRKPR